VTDIKLSWKHLNVVYWEAASAAVQGVARSSHILV